MAKSDDKKPKKDGKRKSKIPKKNKSKVDPDNMLEEVSNTITGQKNILKGEMVNVIDKKLNEKISNQQNEIQALQNIINDLRTKNTEVS
jgi:hypothetical protein